MYRSIIWFVILDWLLKITDVDFINKNRCWGCYLLGRVVQAIGLPTIQQWVNQPRKKTLKTFWYVFFHLICKQMFGNNITKSWSKRILKYGFLLQSFAGNSRVWTEVQACFIDHRWSFKTYALVRMRRSLYSGANKYCFRTYLV